MTKICQTYLLIRITNKSPIGGITNTNNNCVVINNNNCRSLRSLHRIIMIALCKYLLHGMIAGASTKCEREQLVTSKTTNSSLCVIDTNSYCYHLLIRIRKSQNICREIQRVSASLTSVHYMLTTVLRCAILCTSTIKGVTMRLKETTFCLNAKPMKALLWCNKVSKAKRNKPAKINGIQHHEISDSVEHVYYVPIN